MPKQTGIQLNDSITTGNLMDIKIQPKRDASGKIISGLVIGNTLQQNKALILIANQGAFKFRPDLGVGINDLVLNDDYLGYRHIINEHLAKDGMKVTRLDLYPNKPFRLEAYYGNNG